MCARVCPRGRIGDIANLDAIPWGILLDLEAIIAKYNVV